MKKNERIDLDKQEPLAHNPFDALNKQDLPDQPERQEQKNQPPQPDSPPYRVDRTRKGGFDLSIENRSGGKTVTILRRVEGDAEKLAKELRKRLGTGGTVQEDGTAIELQGDHRERIETYLKANL